MKKLFLVLAMVAGFGIFSVVAQDVEKKIEKTEIAQNEEVKYLPIEVKDLPEQVTKTVAEEYAAFTIKEAYQGEAPNEASYKLVLTDAEGVDKEVIINVKKEEDSDNS